MIFNLTLFKLINSHSLSHISQLLPIFYNYINVWPINRYQLFVEKFISIYGCVDEVTFG